MAVTGRTTDGAIVFDDIIDSRGRRVIDVTNRIMDDGTHYFQIDLVPASRKYFVQTVKEKRRVNRR